VQYYLHAQNVWWLHTLHWITRTSLLKTLACKHKSSLTAMAKKHKATVKTPNGETLKCLEARVERGDKPPLIAHFGGIPLQRQPRAILNENLPRPGNSRSELIQRLIADECALCGSHQYIEVHHIRKLADLRGRGRKERPAWAKRMAALRRKTLVVCRDCHDNIHAGRPTRQKVPNEPLESRVL
jgi:hypothetical protein